MIQEFSLFDNAVKICYFSQNCSTKAIRPIKSKGTPEQQAILRPILAKSGEAGFHILVQPDPHPAHAQTEIVRFNDRRIKQRIDLLENGSAILWRGPEFDADGVLIDTEAKKRRMAGFIISADCFTTVIYARETYQLFMLHSGRASLIDENAIKGGEPRPYQSVIDRAMVEIPPELVPSLECAICLGKSKDYMLSTQHPTQGELTLPRVKYIQDRWPEAILQGEIFGEYELLFPKMIELQLRGHGVKTPIFFDGIDTGSDKDAGDNYQWHSQSRGDNGRNGLVVGFSP